MQGKAPDLETMKMMVEEQEVMGKVDAYKPGEGQTTVVATRLQE
jgi:hypothetical protein